MCSLLSQLSFSMCDCDGSFRLDYCLSWDDARNGTATDKLEFVMRQLTVVAAVNHHAK